MSKTRYFRYIPQEYAEFMLQKGSIKLPTVYDWRIGENKEITDSHEAKDFIVAKPLPKRVFKAGEEIPQKYQMNMIQIIGNHPGGIIEGNTFVNEYNYPNMYAYCLTTKPTRKIMREFGQNPDGTYQIMSCLEITDINKFAFAISSFLYNNRLTINPQPKHNKCIYATNGRHYDYDTLYQTKRNNVYFLKERRFAHQNEYRVIFPTYVRDSSLKSQVFTIPDIRKYLRNHTIK